MFFFKIKGLLEKYLVTSSSSSSSSLRRRKQPKQKNYIRPQIDSEYESDELSMSNDLGGRENADVKVNSRSNNANLNQPHHHALVKKYFRIPTTSNKRAWDIQTYYDVFVQNDGSILFIPKDVNKNHYFIG